MIQINSTYNNNIEDKKESFNNMLNILFEKKYKDEFEDRIKFFSEEKEDNNIIISKKSIYRSSNLNKNEVAIHINSSLLINSYINVANQSEKRAFCLLLKAKSTVKNGVLYHISEHGFNKRTSEKLDISRNTVKSTLKTLEKCGLGQTDINDNFKFISTSERAENKEKIYRIIINRADSLRTIEKKIQKILVENEIKQNDYINQKIGRQKLNGRNSKKTGKSEMNEDIINFEDYENKSKIKSIGQRKLAQTLNLDLMRVNKIIIELEKEGKIERKFVQKRYKTIKAADFEQFKMSHKGYAYCKKCKDGVYVDPFIFEGTVYKILN